MWQETTKNGRRYVERYTDQMTGKTKRVSVTVDKFNNFTRKWAADYLAKEIKERQRTPEMPTDITLEKLIDKYREAQKLTVKESTYTKNYWEEEALKKMLEPNVLICRLNVRYIREKFVASGRKPGTLNGYRRRLIEIIGWGFKNDYVSDVQYVNIIKKFAKFNDEPYSRKIADKYLEPEELSKLYQGMEVKKWRAFTKFLVLSGLRSGEAFALTMDDIDFKEHVIHITKTRDPVNHVTTTPKTDCSVRDVFMQPQLEEIARDILTLTRIEMMSQGFRTKLFICGRNGNYVNYFSYEKYLKENSIRILGRRVTAHALRHTHASLLFAEGVDIETISRRLGHRNSTVTREIYLHVTKKLEEKDREQIKAIKIIGI